MSEVAPLVRELAALRNALGLSQGKVASRLHVSKQTVWGWEAGARRMTLAQVYEYGAVLGARPVLRSGARPVVALEVCPPPAPHVTEQGRLPIVRQLRAMRRQQEITVRDLAARLGGQAGSVFGWEAGRRALFVAQAHAYADAVGAVLALEPISESVTALVEAGGRPHVGRTR